MCWNTSSIKVKDEKKKSFNTNEIFIASVGIKIYLHHGNDVMRLSLILENTQSELAKE